MGKQPKLGSGGRFAAGVAQIQQKQGLPADQAKAIMATAGRKKYGAAQMNKWVNAAKKTVK